MVLAHGPHVQQPRACTTAYISPYLHRWRQRLQCLAQQSIGLECNITPSQENEFLLLGQYMYCTAVAKDLARQGPSTTQQLNASLAQPKVDKQHGFTHNCCLMCDCCCNCHSAGPRLLQLRYKLTLTTYRLANTVWNVKLLWHYCTRPLVQGHARLSKHFYPYIQQLAGRSLTTADTQLLAQALAVAMPLAALLLLARVLLAQRRRLRQ